MPVLICHWSLDDQNFGTGATSLYTFQGSELQRERGNDTVSYSRTHDSIFSMISSYSCTPPTPTNIAASASALRPKQSLLHMSLVTWSWVWKGGLAVACLILKFEVFVSSSSYSFSLMVSKKICDRWGWLICPKIDVRRCAPLATSCGGYLRSHFKPCRHPPWTQLPVTIFTSHLYRESVGE
jgi:hypothetical protein